jgi:hypothetical protein
MAVKLLLDNGADKQQPGLDHITIDVLNNSSSTRTVRINVYDRSSGAPILMYTSKLTLKPSSNYDLEVFAGESVLWEVQAVTSSKKVLFWLGAQDDSGMNLDGNVILSSQMRLLYQEQAAARR